MLSVNEFPSFNEVETDSEFYVVFRHKYLIYNPIHKTIEMYTTFMLFELIKYDLNKQTKKIDG
jgi:hypothetical protein